MKNGFSEIGRFIHDGKRGLKFLGKEMRRFRLDIGVEGAEENAGEGISESPAHPLGQSSVSLGNDGVKVFG